MERQSPMAQVFIHLAALCLAMVIIAPVLWLFVMSISGAAALSARPLQWWPTSVDWSRYATLLSRVESSRSLRFRRIIAPNRPPRSRAKRAGPGPRSINGRGNGRIYF